MKDIRPIQKQLEEQYERDLQGLKRAIKALTEQYRVQSETLKQLIGTKDTETDETEQEDPVQEPEEPERTPEPEAQRESPPSNLSSECQLVYAATKGYGVPITTRNLHHALTQAGHTIELTRVRLALTLLANRYGLLDSAEVEDNGKTTKYYQPKDHKLPIEEAIKRLQTAKQIEGNRKLRR